MRTKCFYALPALPPAVPLAFFLFIFSSHCRDISRKKRSSPFELEVEFRGKNEGAFIINYRVITPFLSGELNNKDLFRSSFEFFNLVVLKPGTIMPSFWRKSLKSGSWFCLPIRNNTHWKFSAKITYVSPLFALSNQARKLRKSVGVKSGKK